MHKYLSYAFFLVAILVSPSVYSQLGDMDLEFGNAGIVITDMGADNDFIFDASVLTDGRIIVCGQTATLAGDDFALARYNKDGSLDANFGTAGRVITDFGGDEICNALTVQNDGKIVAVGKTTYMVAEATIVVARYNDDGTLDDTFGTDGKVITDLSGNTSGANDVVVQDDGRIVVGGIVFGGLEQFRLLLLRYLDSGDPDESFGDAGIVIEDLLEAPDERINALALQPDGKIIGIGQAGLGDGRDFLIARFNEDGSFDETFGTNGWTRADVGSGDAVDGLLLGNGMILAGGDGMARFTADGDLDKSFGENGEVKDVRIEALDVQNNGKIVTVDSGPTAITRFLWNGAVDDSFGKMGTKFIDGDQLQTVVAQTDGKILVAGTDGVDFFMARVIGEIPQKNGSLDSAGDGTATSCSLIQR